MRKCLHCGSTEEYVMFMKDIEICTVCAVKINRLFENRLSGHPSEYPKRISLSNGCEVIMSTGEMCSFCFQGGSHVVVAQTHNGNAAICAQCTGDIGPSLRLEGAKVMGHQRQ